MVLDWTLTASAVNHAWLTIRALSWKRVLSCVIVVGTLGISTHMMWKTLRGTSRRELSAFKQLEF